MDYNENDDLRRFKAQDPPLRLGIVSDGTPMGFDVVDTETGRRLEGLQHVKLFADFGTRPMAISAEVQFVVYDDPKTPGVRLNPDQVLALRGGESNVEVVGLDGK